MQTLEDWERESWSGAGAINRPQRWQENSAAFTISQEQELSYWLRRELERSMEWICQCSCDFLLCKAFCNHKGHRKCVFSPGVGFTNSKISFAFLFPVHELQTCGWGCMHSSLLDSVSVCGKIHILVSCFFTVSLLSCYSDIAVYIKRYLIQYFSRAFVELFLKRHILQLLTPLVTSASSP